MKTANRTLTPPHAYRQRVVDPEFYFQNMSNIHGKVNEILLLAQNFESGYSRIALDWAEQLIRMQKDSLIPHASVDVAVLSQIGAAVAKYEESQPGFANGKTSYEFHSILSILGFDEDKSVSIVQTLALDGGYYLFRTKLDAEALAETVRNGF